MFRLIAVTNRALCRGDYLEQVRRVLASGISALILREKDLSPGAYLELAGRVEDLCLGQGVEFIPHTFVQAAQTLNCRAIHLPLPALENDPGIREAFPVTGVSVHSTEQALTAARLGAGYVTAGHIFPTDCKKGLEPRGTSFLREVCAAVSVPVYAIGGISPESIGAVRDAGAAGACLMSSLMVCEDPGAVVRRLLKALA